MKWFLKILIAQCLVLPSAWGFDEKDIPPPPMPDYMQKKDFEAAAAAPTRSTASETKEQEDVPYEDVKREFLQAGEDDTETSAISAVDDVQTGDIEEDRAEPLVQSPQMVVEDSEDPEVDPVNAVEESVPEFEQAEINDPQAEQVRDEYLQSGKEELQEEVEEYKPDEGKPSEELASVEQKLEQAERQAEESLANKERDVSGLTPFKAGMYKFSKECTMYQEDSSFSDKAGVISAGRKLWIDPHSTNWHKAYKKSGAVYISADCLATK